MRAPKQTGTTVLLALLLGLLMLPSVALGAGELDPTFDGDGKVLTDFGGTFDAIGGIAIQTDGKIVAAGQTRGSDSDFALARYNPDGSLDSTFDGDGRVVTDFGASDGAAGVAIQGDGKIVAAGQGANAFALARYNADGSLDTGFDGDGKVLTDFDYASDVAIQADGKIVAVGSSNVDYFALARYNTEGSLDTSFDGDGKVTNSSGYYEGASAVAIQPDGKIVAAGSTEFDPVMYGDRQFKLARFNTNGSLDTSFGGGGIEFTSFETSNLDHASDVLIQADGKIVAAGGSYAGVNYSNPSHFALARYNANGSLDTSFDADGRVLTDFGADDEASSVALQTDGKIVAVGSSTMRRYDGSSLGSNIALARYNADGSLDAPTFGGDGKVLTDFSFEDLASDVAIQADGKIVAAGTSGNDFALARYVPTGPESRISINDVTKLEGNAGVTSFTFTVSLSKPSSETITVSRQTANGTSSAPSDYTALNPATITFLPGQTVKTVTVKVKGEVAIEPNETFFVNLSNATNATIADPQGKGTIQNDDLSPTPACTVTGTRGNDVLNGTSGNDVICGGRGDDQIYGLDGADVLKGEEGNDLLVGGNGYDLLLGDKGIDDLRGGNGNDALRGGDQDDTLNGGANSDALFGDAGADSLNAQDGVSANDSADGGNDSDSCVFDSGDFVTSCP